MTMRPNVMQRLLAMTLIAAACPACSWTSADGKTRNHLVLGVGLVRTSSDSQHCRVGDGLAAKAHRIETTGAVLSPAGGSVLLILGHRAEQSVEVAPDADIVVEVTSRKGQGLSANVQSVDRVEDEPMPVTSDKEKR